MRGAALSQHADWLVKFVEILIATTHRQKPPHQPLLQLV